MATVKTAVSMDKDLFRRIESTRKRMKISRSKLMGQAAREFLERRENKRVLEQINEAYEQEPETQAELDLLRKSARSLGRTLEGEKW